MKPDGVAPDAAPEGDAGVVTSTPLGDPSPCAGTSTTFHLEGDPGDYISGGNSFTTGGSATLDVQCPYSLRFDLSTAAQGEWSISLSSRDVGAPLTTATYEDTERFPFETAPHPGLDVSGDGRGCNMSWGTLQVEDIAWSGSTLQSLTMTFEQYCDTDAGAGRGCFHYQAQ